ncbi:hypothetical protein C8R43DRAFT_1114924 [Mycena crocata]|nr:hypothetical protein C8R43DRAFT_1114924 [Mycena crocata]
MRLGAEDFQQKIRVAGALVALISLSLRHPASIVNGGHLTLPNAAEPARCMDVGAMFEQEIDDLFVARRGSTGISQAPLSATYWIGWKPLEAKKVKREYVA